MHTDTIHRAVKTAGLMTGAFLLLAAGTCSAAVEVKPQGPEQTLFESANRERAARGIGLLKWDDGLAEAARRHALMMAEENQLSHQFAGEPDVMGRVREGRARFLAAAENVAEGRSADNLHTQWMQSLPHRENLLDPEMNSMGVAISEKNGELFAVEDFGETIAAVPLPQQEKQIAAQLEGHGLSRVTAGGDARNVCQGGQGRLSGPGRMFSLRYSTVDLETLPPELLRELQGSRYRVAAVGACEPSTQSDFAGYQIAVLLYQ